MIPWHAITFSKVYDLGVAYVKASAMTCGESAVSDRRTPPKGTAFFDIEWASLKRQAAARLRDKIHAEEFGLKPTERAEKAAGSPYTHPNGQVTWIEEPKEKP